MLNVPDWIGVYEMEKGIVNTEQYSATKQLPAKYRLTENQYADVAGSVLTT